MGTAPDTLRRRFAARLVCHAGIVMPPSRRDWTEAMHCELSHVENDWAALRWALGCLLAAHVERIRALRVMDVTAVRLAAALLIVFRAADAMFATMLTMAYRLNALGTAERLGRMTPGDDVGRLVPLMEAVPLWLHGVAMVAGGLYLAAAVSLVRYRPSAYVLIVLGVGAEVAATQLGRRIAMEVGVAANPNPSMLAAVILPIVLPLLVALAVWSSYRHDAEPPTP